MASFYATPTMMGLRSSTLAPIAAPTPNGQVLNFNTRPNSITIVRTSDFNHYIRPPKTPDEPREDCVLTGFVVTNLTKPKRAKSLELTFVAEVRLAYPDRPWEDHVIFENTMSFDGIGSAGVFIDSGTQLFEYAFVIPSSLAGFDRTPYGRVSHRIQASLHGQPQMSMRFGSFFSSPSRTRSPSPGNVLGGSSRKNSLDRRGTSQSRDSGTSSPGTLTTSPLQSPSLQSPSIASFSLSGAQPSGSEPILSRQGSGLNLPATFTDSLTTEHSLPPGVKWDEIPYLQGTLSASKEMWIVPLPSEDREALPLDLRGRSLVAGLGIVPWSLTTEAITVGGLLFFKSALLDVNPLATVWCVRLFVNQRISLTSPARPAEGETTFPTTNLLLFESGKLPRNPEEWYTTNGAKRCEPIWEGEDVPSSGAKTDKQALRFAEVLRMPNENRLRPSTCPGTVTPIRVTHDFSLQFYFSVWGEDAMGEPLSRPGPGKLRKAVLSQDTLILSCCCTKNNLALPTYEQSTRFSNPTNELDCDRCACGEPLSELSERELARDFINEDGIPFGLLENPVGQAGDRGRQGRNKSVYSPS